MVKGIFRRLRLPLDEKLRYVEKLVAMHLRPIVLSKEIVTDSAVRRLIFEAGEDVMDLLILCEADITSKNKEKVARHISNLRLVADKISEVLSKDELRNWQPVLTGNHIIERYKVNNPKYIGILKNKVRDAILEAKIPNDIDAALEFTDEIAREMGIELI
jgi:hypothetical protein